MPGWWAGLAAAAPIGPWSPARLPLLAGAPQSATPEWNVTAFTAFALVLVAVLLVLARATQSMLPDPSSDAPAEGSTDGPSEEGAPRRSDPPNGEPVDPPSGETVDPAVAETDGADPGGRSRSPAPPGAPPGAGSPLQQFGTGELLANVLLTHGLFAVLVVGAAVHWRVPAAVLGVSVPTPATVALGVAAGVALYVADEVGAGAAARLGVDHAETLRELLAPDSPAGWVLLLGGVLPVIAVSEELVFRAVLVGALSAGLGISPWVLAGASAVAFALGHGAQGRGGVLVTGVLGLVLAAAFVVSGSLALVIVAHYVVNALEFVVHEGLGVEWVGG